MDYYLTLRRINLKITEGYEKISNSKFKPSNSHRNNYLMV